jgi:hypothetical protein
VFALKKEGFLVGVVMGVGTVRGGISVCVYYSSGVVVRVCERSPHRRLEASPDKGDVARCVAVAVDDTTLVAGGGFAQLSKKKKSK